MEKSIDPLHSPLRPRQRRGGTMQLPKPIRLLAAATMALFVFILFIIMRNPANVTVPGDRVKMDDMRRDPNLDPTGEPPEPLHRVNGDNYDPDNPNSDRINATLLSLVRNSEVTQLVQSMQQLERTWNHKFNYPWTFFNDEPFTEEFKAITRAQTKAEVYYHQIPKEHWEVPSWINLDLMKESARMLQEQETQYAGMVSYHQMCRWNSGLFYDHPALKDTQYYWRVEPNVNFFCDVDYDVFRYMRDHNKTYGFTITLYDKPASVTSLWPETQKFLASHPEYLHPRNAEPWLTDREHRPANHDLANGYSTCHFWSNFEIASMDFWRAPAYRAYFEHLDRAGGFFYERWGDAPVHSIALGLFEDSSRLHWFKDIGYRHIPFFNCPNSPKCSACQAGKFYDGEPFLAKEDCRPVWFKTIGNEWTVQSGDGAAGAQKQDKAT